MYSPGGVGTVDTKKENQDNSANIFAWDLTAESTSSGFDTYEGGGNSTLTINGSGGETFRVILGSSVNLATAFWNTQQTWSSILTKSGSATIPTLATGNVSAYTFTAGNYTLVNTTGEGAFSLAGNATTGYSVTWTAVPEPTSALAGLLITAGLLRRRRDAVV